VLTDDIDAGWAHVESWGDTLDGDSRLVACRWDVVPRIDDVIDDVIQTFARVALADWPHWYGSVLAEKMAPVGLEQDLHLRLSLQQISRQQLHVVSTWLHRAAASCLAQAMPFYKEVPRELQAGQLSLAVCSKNLVVALCAASEQSVGAGALVAAAEWLHRVTGARVILLAPMTWQGSADFQRVNVEPEFLSFVAHPAGQAPTTTIGVQVHVTPLEGLPHPGSEAERALYERIKADEELAACLRFNQTVVVDLQQKFRIDIVSRSLKVAIEVDGDDHRVSAAKYCDDCARDYRLMLSGYLVLRLPNQLVLSDPELAMARIRDVVRYRRRNSL